MMTVMIASMIVVVSNWETDAELKLSNFKKKLLNGAKRSSIKNTRNMIVNKNVREAPWEEATRIGFFSLKFAYSDPIPKLNDTSVIVTSAVFNCEIINITAGNW